MKVEIKSSYPLRGHNITSHYSYPVYSDEIEKRMSQQLEFLKKYSTFSLEMRITKNDS